MSNGETETEPGEEKNPTNPWIYAVLAFIILALNFYTLGSFKGFTLAFNSRLLAATIIALTLGIVFGWRSRRYLIALAIVFFVFIYIFLIGGFYRIIFYLIFVSAVIYFGYDDADERDKARELKLIGILLLVDFFFFTLIGYSNTWFKAPADYFLARFNRLTIPIWFYYALAKGRENSIVKGILIVAVVFNVLAFTITGADLQNATSQIIEAPEQLEVGKTHFQEGYETFLVTFMDPVRCIWNMNDPKNYENCLKVRYLTRQCKKEKREGETVQECVLRKLEEEKTTGAVDRTITEFVEVTIDPSTTKKEFKGPVEIIYSLKIKSTKVPISFSSIECIFTNKGTKENITGDVRTTIPLNEETQFTTNTILVTCILPEENRQPGKYENTLTVSIQDVDTYATLALYFIGNTELLNSIIYKTGDESYTNLFSNERREWPNQVANVLVDGKVQSRAYPGLIWPRIGEPLQKGQIATLPIKSLREKERLQMSMSIVNKGTGKITDIEDIILEVPEYTALIQEYACTMFELVGETRYSIAEDDQGKALLNSIIKILAEQKKESEEGLLSCFIEITHYPNFIENPNTPTGPKYFTLRIIDYDYEIKSKHSFEIAKSAQEILASI